MRKLSGFVISLPMLIVPPLALGKPALAGEIGPAGAVEILAQSRAADAKCKHLTPEQHDELGGYVAKAEVVAAAAGGAGAARSARRNGTGRGDAMTCGEESKAMVQASLDAARRAMAYAEEQAQRKAQQKQAAAEAKAKAKAKPKQAAVKPRPEKPKTVVQASVAPPAMEPAAARPEEPVSSAGLAAYQQVTTAYYLERRCQHLQRADTMAFWRSIVARHNQAVRQFGGSAVARAKSAAESAASRQGACGSRTAMVVKRGYSAIR